MLLRFSVENWMSFRDEATLDLSATREKQHPEHVALIKKHNLRLLPVAAIYGGNASGKSNFIEALNFVEGFITDPPKAGSPIPVKPFRMDKGFANRPTTFSFEILVEDTIYDYMFSVTGRRVVGEELKRIGVTREETLFRRGALPGDFLLAAELKDQEELRFAFRGTQDNQLYLTNSVSQKLEEFGPVFDWFAKSLTIIRPAMHCGGLPILTDESNPRSSQISRRLRDLDSGIDRLRSIGISPESVMSKEQLESISANLREGVTLPLETVGGEDGVFLSIHDGKVITRRLIPIHLTDSGDEIPFSYSDESEGTRRLIDLLPAFLHLEDKRSSAVYVIDELDRSLHSNLTTDLLVHYLEQRRTALARCQLIFTTHDTQLLTQEIFRRDEIWITERDRSGASKLVAFSEFKDVRKDKDIRKSYLQGRLGGVPRIRATSSACEDEAAVR
jgi:hypothetical protein